MSIKDKYRVKYYAFQNFPAGVINQKGVDAVSISPLNDGSSIILSYLRVALLHTGSPNRR